jgi:DNA polymerase V
MDLFASRDPEKLASLMTAIDALNSRHGRDAVRPGGLLRSARVWSMKRGNLSPCYTTRVTDLLTVKAR